ncbi:MAG: hypothetical protein AAGC65_08805 [Mucilaginibacter sp.]|uniref:hypothetical protein n=1 Tax=Mucilaginibacter sp. TaxID=1882438 RepID=UPI0031B41CD8
MKKLILLFVLITGISTLTYAQNASPVFNANKDAVTYLGHKISINSELKLLYGAKPDKGFVFAYSNLINNQLSAGYANEIVVVKELKEMNGKLYASGTFKTVTGILNSKTCLIDIQGAIDWKEIQVEL